MKILKSIGAVVAGFVTVFVLSVLTDLIVQKIGLIPNGALFDNKLLLIALIYRTIYTVLGGYITAKLSPDNPMRHAIILGIIGTIAGVIGAVTHADLGPVWYAWGLVALAFPSVWLGAKLKVNRLT